MNPLKNKQYNLLKGTGNEDLANKVNEIVDKFNKLEKPASAKPWKVETGIKEGTINMVAHRIFHADTEYDAVEILFDFVKKL